MEDHQCQVQCSANYMPLTPINFLERAAIVYGDKTAIVYGDKVRYSWIETHQICLKLASALSQLQISRGDIVAALAPNIPALYKLHFAVPMAGAILSALNTGLDSIILASILQQLETKIIFVDYQFMELVLKSLDILSQTTTLNPPLLVIIQECDQKTPSNFPSGMLDYNALIKTGRVDFEILQPENECDPISINYTSGSTGNPKGVVYSHRGTYLNSLAQISRFDMKETPTTVFLWTVDMFRCNGWCCTWAMAALGGVNICLRNVTRDIIFDSIILNKVTHLCGKPTLLNIISNSPHKSNTLPLQPKVNVIVAGPLPRKQVLESVSEIGFNIIDSYGMTEVLGPAIVRPMDGNDNVKCREGLNSILIQRVDVKDLSTMKSVPYDGKTIGEVMFQGNTLMSRYFKNPKATQEAFKDGWYHTGDLGVRHIDGRIQLKDRKKDIIVSGEETISTLEVEAVLLSNLKVLEAAVVGKPYDDHKLKEVPCAFVKLKKDCVANVEELVEFCGNQLPSFMVPKAIVFGDLPLNSTGKVQKYVLREKAKALV